MTTYILTGESYRFETDCTINNMLLDDGIELYASMEALDAATIDQGYLDADELCEPWTITASHIFDDRGMIWVDVKTSIEDAINNFEL